MTSAQKKGPAEAATSPSHGPTNPSRGMEMNKRTHSMTAAEAAIPPAANHYAEAFYALEDHISCLRRRAKVARFLLDLVEDRCRDAFSEGDRELMDVASSAMSDAYEDVRELDRVYLDLLNDLDRRASVASAGRAA